MQNRVPRYPGRVKLVPVNGQENTYDMVRADEPQMEGTPINKATLLKDATAALFGLGTEAVPDDVMVKIKELLDGLLTTANSKARIQTGSYTGTGTYGASNPCSLTFDFVPQLIVFFGSYAEARIDDAIHPIILLWGISEAFGISSYTDQHSIITYSEKTMSWYSLGAKGQYNEARFTYRYVVIG